MKWIVKQQQKKTKTMANLDRDLSWFCYFRKSRKSLYDRFLKRNEARSIFPLHMWIERFNIKYFKFTFSFQLSNQSAITFLHFQMFSIYLFSLKLEIVCNFSNILQHWKIAKIPKKNSFQKLLAHNELAIDVLKIVNILFSSPSFCIQNIVCIFEAKKMHKISMQAPAHRNRTETWVNGIPKWKNLKRSKNNNNGKFEIQ